MPPKDDHVYAFLTDLHHARTMAKRLYQRAEEMPDVVIAYVESLPKGWENNLDDELRDALFKAYRKALQSRSHPE